MQWTALATVGLGIGLLAGLAVSPVLSIILGSVVGAAATVTAIFGNYGGAKTGRAGVTPQPAPLALLVVTILLGAVLGMTSRIDLALSNQAARVKGLDLAPPENIAESIQAWTDLGLDKKEVTRSLFEAFLGVSSAAAEQTVAQTARSATVGLFSAIGAEECTRLKNVSDASLRSELRAGESDEVAAIADRVEDPETLRLVVEVVCPQQEE